MWWIINTTRERAGLTSVCIKNIIIFISASHSNCRWPWLAPSSITAFTTGSTKRVFQINQPAVPFTTGSYTSLIHFARKLKTSLLRRYFCLSHVSLKNVISHVLLALTCDTVLSTGLLLLFQVLLCLPKLSLSLFLLPFVSQCVCRDGGGPKNGLEPV